MRDEIRRLADENVYMVDYLLGQAETKASAEEGKVFTRSMNGENGTGLLTSDDRGVTFADLMSEGESEEEWIGVE
jgi:periodic tryptophan protein 2